MKNTSKRIIISVLTLVLTVVALGTTTFAWFSLSNVSKVSGIEGTITGGDGLEVQLSGEGYNSGFKNNLTSAEWGAFMDKVNEKNEGNFEFQAVTTTGDENHTMTKLGFTGQNGTDNKLVLGQTTEANKDYLEFTLTFRSQNAGKINLTSLSFSGDEVTFTPDGADYLQTPDFTGKKQVKTSAANAARISFQAEETINAYQKIAVAYDSNQEIITGNSAENNPVQNGQWSYLASKNIDIYTNDNLADKLEFADAQQIKMLNATGVNGEIASGGDQIVELSGVKGNYTASVTVRIWIEGWDADTYDAVFNAGLKIDMIFNKVETNPEG